MRDTARTQRKLGALTSQMKFIFSIPDADYSAQLEVSADSVEQAQQMVAETFPEAVFLGIQVQ